MAVFAIEFCGGGFLGCCFGGVFGAEEVVECDDAVGGAEAGADGGLGEFVEAIEGGGGGGEEVAGGDDGVADGFGGDTERFGGFAFALLGAGEALAVGDDEAASRFRAALNDGVEAGAESVVGRHVDGFFGASDDEV